MTCQIGPRLMVFTMLAALAVAAQDVPSSSNPAPPAGPTPAYTQVDPGKSLDFLGEAVSNSNLNLGMNLMAAYDTNVAAFSTKPESQASYLVAPHIGITQLRPKLSLSASYDGGLGIYEQLPNSNSFSQTASADVLYQFTPHWQLHASDHYSYSANPFGNYFTIIGQPTPNDPNPATFIPFANTNQNMAELDLADQLTRYDTLTFTGNEAFRRYSNYSTSTQVNLYNMISYTGGMNYSHKFSPKFSMGGGYNFNSLDFSHGQQKSGISTIQIFASYQLTRSLSISGWMGPEYISSKTIFQYFIYVATLYQSTWTPAGGINLGWQGLRDSFTAGFSKSTSDGGGLLATTTIYSVNAAYRRKLAARWDTTASMIYGNNNSFAASNLNPQLFPSRSYSTLQAFCTLNRLLTPRVNAQLQYGYTHEIQKNIYLVGTGPAFNDNRIAISVQYIWNHPLGW